MQQKPAMLLLFFLLATPTIAQTTLDKTLETFSFAIGKLGLGTNQNDFFNEKYKLHRPEPSATDFRDIVTEPIEKNGLKSMTYYFDAEGERPLYEIIIEFDTEGTRAAVAEKLFGASNYPGKPDHWIAGASAGVVNLAWAFDKKLVIAANLPNTEWYGDELFNIPAGFEMYKHLPQMSEWPTEERARFSKTLEVQVLAGADNFYGIRQELDGFGSFVCTSPLAGAEVSSVFQTDEGKWIVSNTVVSGSNADNAILWRLDAANLFDKLETSTLKLKRAKSKQEFGTRVEIWDVQLKSGAPSSVQIGLMQYEKDAAGLWSIDVLVMRQ